MNRQERRAFDNVRLDSFCVLPKVLRKVTEKVHQITGPQLRGTCPSSAIGASARHDTPRDHGQPGR
jgi:hypothetical protein